MGERRYSSTHSQPWHQMEMSGCFTPRPLYLQKKHHRRKPNKRLDRPSAGLDTSGSGQIILPLLRIEPLVLRCRAHSVVTERSRFSFRSLSATASSTRWLICRLFFDAVSTTLFTPIDRCENSHLLLHLIDVSVLPSSLVLTSKQIYFPYLLTSLYV